jgi:hypothetical protein
MKDDWIEERVREAQGTSVPEAVATIVKEQLTGTMRERALRPAELSTVSKSLLDAMETTSAVKASP